MRRGDFAVHRSKIAVKPSGLTDEAEAGDPIFLTRVLVSSVRERSGVLVLLSVDAHDQSASVVASTSVCCYTCDLHGL